MISVFIKNLIVEVPSLNQASRKYTWIKFLLAIYLSTSSWVNCNTECHEPEADGKEMKLKDI